ncbi:hypothetical protein ACQP2U_43445 (plasmid) [Nocardia sp. CA-084685]|uniref:hypothetical protein n=1 Tax=Nocardia sp. CA-084685 TaxID=3239970 RepID=UPI003D98F464
MVADVPAGRRSVKIGFNYDYRMGCATCGRVSTVTAHRYQERLGIDALSPCEHCGTDIHYGPAAAALRDDNDPVLSDVVTAQGSWFHSSTYADWPSPDYEWNTCAGLDDEIVLGDVSPERIRHRLLTRALHLGNYETAVENMLRRLRDQGDANSTFYLHRVTLRVTPDTIEDGFRDENHAPASDLSIDELEQAGLLAVRYLNVHEAMGSLSLAIDPAALATVATIELPVHELAVEPPPQLVSRLAELDGEITAADETLPDTSHIDPIELRMRELFMEPGDELAAAISTATRRSRAAWDEAQLLLEQTYLGASVNPVVRADFISAMTSADNDSIQALHNRVRAYAALFTHPEGVVNAFNQQPVRNAEESPLVQQRRHQRSLHRG